MRPLMGRRHVVRATLVGLLLSVGAAVPAQAGRAKTAVLIRGMGPGSEKVAAYVSHYVGARYGADARYDRVDLSAVLGDSEAEKAKLQLDGAREAVLRGKAAYEEFELERAGMALSDALAIYRRYSLYLSSLNEIGDLLMMLGAIYSLQGENESARQKMGQAYNLNAQIEPDPRLYNPSMRKLFNEAVETVAKKQGATLSLASNPSYARAYVDGKFIGVTPSYVDGLLPGRHHIKMVKDGFRTWGRVIQIGSSSDVVDAEQSETANLESTTHINDFEHQLVNAILALAEHWEEQGRGALPEAIEEVGTLLNADHLVLGDVRLQGDQVRVRLLQVDLNALSDRERWVASGLQVFAYSSKAEVYEREMGELVNRVLPPPEKGPVSRDSGLGNQSEPVPRRWGDLVAMGDPTCMGMHCGTFKGLVVLSAGALGVASMAGGGALWAMAKAEHDIYRGNSDSESQPAQVSQHAENLRSAGQSKALWGDVLMGAGVAAMAASVIAYLYWEPGVGVDDVARQTGGGWSLGALPIRGGAAVQARWRF